MVRSLPSSYAGGVGAQRVVEKNRLDFGGSATGEHDPFRFHHGCDSLALTMHPLELLGGVDEEIAADAGIGQVGQQGGGAFGDRIGGAAHRHDEIGVGAWARLAAGQRTDQPYLEYVGAVRQDGLRRGLQTAKDTFAVEAKDPNALTPVTLFDRPQE